MGYFDDLHFLDGDVYNGCPDWFEAGWPGTYSLELKLGGRLSLSRDGGRGVVCEGPVLFWHHPSHHYRYGPPEPGDRWDHHWVLFAGERGRHLIEDGFEPLSPNGWLTVTAPRAMGLLFHELVASVRSKDHRQHGAAVILMERILVMAEDQVAGSDADVRAVAEAVRLDPFHRWDWQKEARSLGISLVQFRRRFRRTVGSPPHAWLLRAKMYAAADRLVRERLDITTLAQDCGLAPAHFSRAFRATMGVSPKAFRDRRPESQASMTAPA